MPSNYKTGGMPRQNKLFYIIIWLIVSAGGLFFFYDTYKSLLNKEITLIQQIATKEILSAGNYCNSILNTAENNLTLISDSNYMNHFIPLLSAKPVKASSSPAEADLAQFIAQLLKINKMYYSIEIVDNSGKERIKVTNTKHGETIIPFQELKNISRKYYFLEGLKIKRNSTYYSKIDLERENDAIAFPFRPSLHIGKGIYSHDHKLQGIILINLGINFALSPHISILSENGDWLVGGDENWMNFAFNRPDNFSTIYPDAWSVISTNEFGNTKSQNGTYFEFTTLRPPFTDKGINWKITTQHSTTEFAGTANLANRTPIILLSLLFELVATGIIIISYIRQKKLFNYQHIIETNLEHYDISLKVGRAMSWIYTPQNRRFKCSKHAETLLGIPADKYLTEEFFIKLFNETPSPGINNFFTFINSIDANEKDSEFSIEHKVPLPQKKHNFSCSEIWLKTYAIKQKDNNNKTIIYGISIDITNRILLEQSSIDARKASEKLSLELQNLLDESERLRIKAEEASSAKADFLANVSHEIRTPMNSVLGMVCLLEDTELSAQQNEYITAIRHSGEALLLIINDILDHSKIESGNLEIVNGPFNIRKTISHIIEMIRPQAEKNNITINCEISPEIPATLLGDELRITQVLLNIAGNAAKFTTSGNIDFQIRIISNSTERITLEISVADTGIGIAPEALENIFDKFTQADQSTTRKFGGTGLGLSICKSLIELMRGKISVESTLGESTTFTIMLPLQKITDSMNEKYAPNINTNLQININENITYPQAKILLCEDNEMNQKLCLKFLEKFDTTADIAANGLIAVDMFTAQKYDLILMDLQMPEMSGISAATRIREIEKEQQLPHTPIIAVTANIFDEDKQACYNAGMDSFLAKPVSLNDFKDALVSFLPQQLQKTGQPATKENISGTEPQPADRQLIDFNTGIKHSGGEQTYKTMISLFCDDAPKVCADIINAAEKNRFSDATRYCHTLKSMAGIIGAKYLNKLAYSAEHATETAEILRIHPDIKETLQKVIYELNQYISDERPLNDTAHQLTTQMQSTEDTASAEDKTIEISTATAAEQTVQNIDDIDEISAKTLDDNLGIYNSGCQENFQEMLKIFKREVNFIIQGIEFESLSGNTGGTFQNIRTLKNMASIIGACRLYNSCIKAEASNDCYVVQKILPIINTEIKNILNKISELLV